MQCYLGTLGTNSHRTIRTALATIAEIISGETVPSPEQFRWELVTPRVIDELFARLAQRDFKPATINKMLSALRGVSRACDELQLVDPETVRAASDRQWVPVERTDDRVRTVAELKTLFKVCHDDPNPSGRRNAALLAVLLCGGLRRSEVVSLDLVHFSHRQSEIFVPHMTEGPGRFVKLSSPARKAAQSARHNGS